MKNYNGYTNSGEKMNSWNAQLKPGKAEKEGQK